VLSSNQLGLRGSQNQPRMAVPRHDLHSEGNAGTGETRPSVSGIELVSTTKLREFLTSAAESPNLSEVGLRYIFRLCPEKELALLVTRNVAWKIEPVL
jgi:hypothetical protein